MHFLITALVGAAALHISSTASTSQHSRPYVDLGYERYFGIHDETSGLNIFRGIRYAAPPKGRLRWQAPRAPKSNRSSILQATEFPPRCPQALSVLGFSQQYLGPRGTDAPSDSGYAGNEDCLFLNVYAPIKAKNLPVLIWIHGGGYGAGDCTYKPVALLQANGNGFIVVVIQYRLGAFGWLSSNEVYRRGVVNAGFLDQRFVLHWVQRNIAKFGGSPRAVTLSGQSAGGGSVMLHAIAYHGLDRANLFANLIASSPYLPGQYDYNGSMPSDSFNQFAQAAGCPPNQSGVFDCLVEQDTSILQKANNDVTNRARYGMWAFGPVTDYKVITQRPSQQLQPDKPLNGQRLLTSSTANEGSFFTPRNISTDEDFTHYIHTLLPLLDPDLTDRVLQTYAPLSTQNYTTPFSTTGTSPPTALEVSNFAAGPQQRALNLNAEVTFTCPAYWLADAFSAAGNQAWKYEYSLPPAFHAADLFGNGWVDDPTQNIPVEFARRFRESWGKFIMSNDPGWTPWSLDRRLMQNFNVTGGFVERNFSIAGLVAAQSYGADVRVDNRLVDGEAWEGGRGARCAFWKGIADAIPA